MNLWTSLMRDLLTPDQANEFFNRTAARYSRLLPPDKSRIECIKDLFMAATILKDKLLLDKVFTLNQTFCHLAKEDFLKIEDLLAFGFEPDWKISGIFYSIYPPDEIDESTKTVLKDIYQEAMGKKGKFSQLLKYRAVQICHQALMEKVDEPSYKKKAMIAPFKLKLREKHLYYLSQLTFSTEAILAFNFEFTKRSCTEDMDDEAEATRILMDPNDPKHADLVNLLDDFFVCKTTPIADKARLNSILPREICTVSEKTVDKGLKQINGDSEKIEWIRQFIQSIYLMTDDPEFLRIRIAYAAKKIHELILKKIDPKPVKQLKIKKEMTSKSLTQKKMQYILDDLERRSIYLLSGISSVYIKEDKLEEMIKFLSNIKINKDKLNKLIDFSKFSGGQINKGDLDEVISSISINSKELKQLFPEYSNVCINDDQYSRLKSACQSGMIEDLKKLSESINKSANDTEKLNSHNKLKEKIRLLCEISSSINGLYWSGNKFSLLSKQCKQVQEYFASLILTSPKGKDAAVVKNLISLSEMALERKNFNIANILFLVLSYNNIARLKATRNVINNNASYQALDNLFSPISHQSNYYKSLSSSATPPFPIISNLKAEILLAKENSETHIEEMLKKHKKEFLRRQTALLASYPVMERLLKKSDIFDVLRKRDKMLAPPSNYDGQAPWHELNLEDKWRFYSEKKSPRKEHSLPF
jgi:hypothetical protein